MSQYSCQAKHPAASLAKGEGSVVFESITRHAVPLALLEHARTLSTLTSCLFGVGFYAILRPHP